MRLRDVGVRKHVQGWLRPVLLVGVLAFVLAGCASTSNPHAKPAGQLAGAPQQIGAQSGATASTTFAAYDAKGKLTVAVSASRSGQCWTTSIAAQGHAAYRCFSGNKILDPCFVSPHPSHPKSPKTVACLADPWSKAVVLHLTAPLPKGKPVAGPSRPWAFELDNGLRCVTSTGTVPYVAGYSLLYQCANGAAAAIVDGQARHITVEYATAGSKTVQQRGVRAMWRT